KSGRLAEEGNRGAAEAELDELQLRHEQVASELLPEDSYANMCKELDDGVGAIRVLLCEIESNRCLSPRAHDNLLGFGESFSSKIISAALRHEGVDAELVASRSCIVTASRHTQASPLWEETNQCLQAVLTPLLEQRRVPVMGGFVGATRTGVPTTLGRGGSDFRATIVGGAVHACRVEIWSGVDWGMYVDPSRSAFAHLIR